MAKSWYFLVMLVMPLRAQTVVLTVEGRVVDARTREPLPSATIRLVETQQGTITNRNGEFRFSVPAGSTSIAVSYIGYHSDTLRIDDAGRGSLVVALQPDEIRLPGIVITGEDPANDIIRRAIAEKKRWMSSLHTFEGKAFNRTQIRTDSAIAAITEAYSTLYWSRNDSLREVVTQQRQTGNMPKGIQPSRVGTVMNFNDDEIRQGGYTFIGPTAPDAFEYYEYRLLRTRPMNDFEVYDIEVIPRSSVTPLLKGRISIAERSYAVMDVDLSPNEAFVQPFVKFRSARYRESFQLYRDRFWLPSSFRFDAAVTIALMGFSFPVIGIERDVVVYDYTVNPLFADSVHRLPGLSVDSSAVRFDSAYWAKHDVLPLTTEQETAYRDLDSTQSLEQKLAPGGAAAAFLNSTGSMFGVADVWFNRVEGWHLGASKSFSDVLNGVDLRGMAGYGMSDREWKYEAGATVRFGEPRPTGGAIHVGNIPSADHEFLVDLSGYRTHRQLPSSLLNDRFGNSIAALFAKDDAYDYYEAAGATATFFYVPVRGVRLSAAAIHEEQRSLTQRTEYSFFSRDVPYRAHPSVVDGLLNSVSASAAVSLREREFMPKRFLSLKVVSEYTTPRLQSDFDYLRTGISIKGMMTTMERNLLFPPSLSLSVEGGFTAGHLPPQRYYSLGSNLYGFIAGEGLHGVKAREYYGDSYWMVSVEHNFRRTLFAPLGIQWLTESNLEFILRTAAARSHLSSRALRSPTFPAVPTNGTYYEAGFAVSNILDLFRADITLRMTPPVTMVFTLGLSDFLTGFIEE